MFYPHLKGQMDVNFNINRCFAVRKTQLCWKCFRNLDFSLCLITLLINKFTLSLAKLHYCNLTSFLLVFILCRECAILVIIYW